MRNQSMITTNQLAFSNIDGADWSQSFCAIDDYGTPQDDEAFEVETGYDDDHLVLCNRRLDYQMRSRLLNHVCLYSFFSEYRKAKMTLRDKNLLLGGSQSATTISRGRRLNDRWLFRTDHPQYSTHILISPFVCCGPGFSGSCYSTSWSRRYGRKIRTSYLDTISSLDDCIWYLSCEPSMLQPTFSSKSNKVISNIQLLHECKRDRDDDLFQLVNKPIVSKPMSTPQSYIDTSIEGSEQLLALLEARMDADQPLINQDMSQHEGLRGRINREYVDTTIQNVIRSERFSHVSDVSGLSELMTNNSITSSRRTTVDEVVARQANFEDIQQICGWQHDLKIKKMKSDERSCLVREKNFPQKRRVVWRFVVGLNGVF